MHNSLASSWISLKMMLILGDAPLKQTTISVVWLVSFTTNLKIVDKDEAVTIATIGMLVVLHPNLMEWVSSSVVGLSYTNDGSLDPFPLYCNWLLNISNVEQLSQFKQQTNESKSIEALLKALRNTLGCGWLIAFTCHVRKIKGILLSWPSKTSKQI